MVKHGNRPGASLDSARATATLTTRQASRASAHRATPPCRGGDKNSAEPESSNQKSVLLLHGKNFSGAYREPHCYQLTFQALAYNTRGLLDLLDVDRVHVLGHSMGGMLATRFALMFPERTEQLALVNPIGLENWKALGVSYRTVDDNYAQELKTTPESIREYERMSYFGGQWNSALTSDMIFTQPVLYEFPLVATRTLLIIGQRGGDRRRRHLPQIEAFDQYFQALLGL